MKQYALILAILAALLMLGACSRTTPAPPEAASVASPDWQQQYDLGMRLLTQGNYQEAIIAFRAAIEINPRQAQAYLGLADAYVGLGDVEAAIEALRAGIDLADDARLQERMDELERLAQDSESSLGPDTEHTPESEQYEFVGEFTLYGTVAEIDMNDPTFLSYVREFDGRVGFVFGITFPSPIVLDTGETVGSARFANTGDAVSIFGEELLLRVDVERPLMQMNPNIFGNTYLMTGRLFYDENASELMPATGNTYYLYNPWGEYRFEIISASR